MTLMQPNLSSKQIIDTIHSYNNLPKTNQEPNSNSNFVLAAAVTYLPKDNPKRPKGEDAHFICKDTNTIGVADGVGGWIKKGIDSGIYSRTLMRNCAHCLRNNNAIKSKGVNYGINLRSVLEEAFSKTKVKGSSTACLVSLSGRNLHALNVGDSGFLVVRNGEVIFQSPINQRTFNHPFQLGIESEDPSIAEEFYVTVEIGDVVVLGTDGLFDNMEVIEIIDEVNRGVNCDKGNNTVDLEMMSSRIANLALYNSFDRYSETPFSRNSKKAGFPFRGGKVDDITVIVAHIQAPRHMKKHGIM